MDMSSGDAVALYQAHGAHKDMGEENTRTLFDLARSKKSFSRRPPVTVFLPGQARTGAAAAQQLANPSLNPALASSALPATKVKIPKSRLEAIAAQEAAALARENATAAEAAIEAVRDTVRLAEEALEKVKSQYKTKLKPTGLAAMMKSANVTEESARKEAAKKAVKDAKDALVLAQTQAAEADQVAVAAELVATQKKQHADQREEADKAKAAAHGRLKASRKLKHKNKSGIKSIRLLKKRRRTVRRRRQV